MPAQYGGHEHLFITNKVRSVQCRAGCGHLLDSGYLLKVVPTQRTQAYASLNYAQLLCPVSPLELGEEWREKENVCVLLVPSPRTTEAQIAHTCGNIPSCSHAGRQSLGEGDIH